MRKHRQSYMAYAIGCAIVWAGIVGVLAATGRHEKIRRTP